TLSGEGLYGFVEEGFDAPLTIETVLDCPTALDGRATVVKVNPIVNTIPIEIMLNLLTFSFFSMQQYRILN
ncbi:MAG: hypothetical protein WBF33_39930, partial [Candidatus Nitrosopolaris sp.]